MFIKLMFFGNIFFKLKINKSHSKSALSFPLDTYPRPLNWDWCPLIPLAFETYLLGKIDLCFFLYLLNSIVYEFHRKPASSINGITLGWGKNLSTFYMKTQHILPKIIYISLQLVYAIYSITFNYQYFCSWHVCSGCS